MKKLIISALPILLAAGCYTMDENDLAELTAKVESHLAKCPEGFTGENCALCQKGYFGPSCQPCSCLHGTCHDGIYGTGHCKDDSCTKGWQGDDCNTCTNGYYGPDCLNDCTHGIIDRETGKCGSCNDGWDINKNCNVCASDYIGPNCVKINCKNGNIDTTTGKCLSCYPGWDLDKNCNDCASDFYGENCEDYCNCNGHGTCIPGPDGTICQCENNWTGTNCNKCNNGYGINCLEYGSVTDADGNIYKTVIINDREWMADNSKYKGNKIQCYTNDSVNNFYNIYGCLYMWDDAQLVCPEGWEVPSSETYNNLINYIGKNDFLAFIAKSADWQDYQNKGTDKFGFSALPAGYAETSYYSSYNDLGKGSYFWTSVSANNYGTLFQIIPNDISAYIARDKINAYSVRCIKSINPEE